MTAAPLAVRRWWPLPLGVAYYLYVWLQDPGLQFESTVHFAPFLRGAHSATGAVLGGPGGPLCYLAAWLAQYVYYPWRGALLLTLLAAVVCFALERLTRSLTGASAGWLALAPATLLLVLYPQLGWHGADLAGVAGALAGAVAYAALAPRQPARRALVFVALSLALYWLLGPPVLLFTVLSAVVEMRIGAGRLAGLLYLLCAEVIPQVLGVALLGLGLQPAFAANTPFDVRPPAGARLGLLALWLLVVVLAAWPRRRAAAPVAATPPRQARLLAVLAALLLLAPVLLAARGRQATTTRVSALVACGRYEEALRAARRYPLTHPPGETVSATNYALYRLGRLGEEMFRYPQSPEGLLLGMICGPGLSPPTVRLARHTFPFESSRTLLELGLVNQAEWGASEALEEYGPHTRTLEVLARVNQAKGRPEAAAGFLAALACNPVRGAWGRTQLAALAADPTGRSDPLVQALRAARLPTESGAYEFNLEQQCLALLKHYPRNRMAFEYLLSTYLLNRNLERFAAEVERLPGLGYAEVPRHWQEALALHQARSGRWPELPGYRLDPATMAAFVRFSDTVAPLQQRGDTAGAQAAVREEFGNTYFYYYVFGVCGEGRQ